MTEAERQAKREYNKSYYANNRAKVLARVRKRSLGVTQEQFDAMAKAQDYKCAVCGTDDPGASRDWQVDHNHATGDIRGLLCMGCNLGLGHFRDNVATLSNAIEYLKRTHVR
jgi:5-methylcytosine-specific restriction endonuclease McrA